MPLHSVLCITSCSRVAKTLSTYSHLASKHEVRTSQDKSGQVRTSQDMLYYQYPLQNICRLIPHLHPAQ
jgi:hypothetical protein